MSIGKLLRKEKRDLDLINNLISAGKAIKEPLPPRKDNTQEYKQLMKELRNGVREINKRINKTK